MKGKEDINEEDLTANGFSVNAFVLSFLGHWPYQNKWKRTIIRVTGNAMMIVANLTSFIALYHVRNDFDAVVERIPMCMTGIFYFIIFFTLVTQLPKMKVLLDDIKKSFREIKRHSEEEVKILVHSAEEGRVILFGYIFSMATGTLLYILATLVPIGLDIVMPLNDSRTRNYIYDVDYVLFEKEEHYYFIFCHSAMSGVYTVGVSMAFDMMLYLFVKHISAMFQVLGHRLKHIGEDQNLYQTLTKEDYTGILNDAYNIVETNDQPPPVIVVLPSDWRWKTLVCFNSSLRTACEEHQMADPRDIQHMVAGRADYVKFINDFQRKTAKKISTFLAQMYPDTFYDKINGKKVRQGMETMESPRIQICCATDYRKDKKESKERTVDVLEGNTENQADLNDRPNVSKKHDEYGCIAYAPQQLPGETSETGENKSTTLLQFYQTSNYDDVAVPVLRKDTYPTQRSMINAQKDRMIEKVIEDWSFFNFPAKLINHVSRLLGKPLQTVWQDSLTAVANNTSKYFKQFCIERKKKAKDVKQKERINKMIELMQEAKNMTSIVGASGRPNTIVCTITPFLIFELTANCFCLL